MGARTLQIRIGAGDGELAQARRRAVAGLLDPVFIHHALGDGPAAPDLLVDLSRLAAILYIEAHLQIVAV